MNLRTEGTNLALFGLSTSDTVAGEVWRETACIGLWHTTGRGRWSFTKSFSKSDSRRWKNAKASKTKCLLQGRKRLGRWEMKS